MEEDYVSFEQVSNMKRYFEYSAFPEHEYQQCVVTTCSMVEEKSIFDFNAMKLLLH